MGDDIDKEGHDFDVLVQREWVRRTGKYFDLNPIFLDDSELHCYFKALPILKAAGVKEVISSIILDRTQRVSS